MEGGFILDQVTNKILVNLMNLSDEDIESINSFECDGKQTFNVKLSKSKLNACPYCGSVSNLSKGFYKKRITISDELFKTAYVYVKVRRYYCTDCKHSFHDEKHFSPRASSISYGTISKIMELLKDPHITFKTVARICNISESSVIRIFDKHCHIKKITWPEVLCMDEVYAKNTNYKSKYICVFYDFYKHTIVDVLPDRKKDYLLYYFSLSANTGELLSVKYVCIDMNSVYKYIIKRYFKKAIICVDSFHVVKQLNDSFSKLRVRIMNSYDSSSIEYYLLKNFRFLLLKNDVNLDNKAKWNKRLKQYINYRGLLEMILSIDKELDQAYKLKQKYITFNTTSSLETAKDDLNQLIESFRKANIAEYEDFTNTIYRWRQEIINSFTVYKGRRINNGVAESINSLISTVLFNTKGIHNHERRRKRIMYSVNKEGFLLK